MTTVPATQCSGIVREEVAAVMIGSNNTHFVDSELSASLIALRRMIVPHFDAVIGQHPLAGVAVAFVGGLLASLSPCLYPMIPITISIVAGSPAAPRRRQFGLAAVYVAGLASVYALLGVLAGLTGSMFGTVSTNPWLYFVMANIMLAAGAMMADIIAVPIPASLQQRAASMGTGGRISGAFAMGAASGLVAAPCGVPTLASILTWVEPTHSSILEFTYLL